MPGHAPLPDPDLATAAAALGVLDDHMVALNARDNEALTATLHFPHYRISANGLKIWDTGASYLDDFYARAGDDWGRSQWDFRNVIAAGPDKVHLDVQFTRFDKNDVPLGVYRSLWIVTSRDGRWAALARSSFAG